MFPSPVDYFRIHRRRPSLGEGRTAAFVFIATAPSFARWPPDSVFGSAQRFLVGLRSRTLSRCGYAKVSRSGRR
jgi:hypothetical protein